MSTPTKEGLTTADDALHQFHSIELVNALRMGLLSSDFGHTIL
jgi:hypothetical protein